MQDYVIGIDVGGTNIKAGAVDHQGNLLAQRKTPTEAGSGSDAILDRIGGLVRDLQNDCSDRRLKAAGFGIPGAIQSKTGIVTQAPNVPAWDGLPIRNTLQERTGVPCFIENDANAIALGEMWVGSGRGYNHIVVLTLGTGVGGGVIVDGKLLRGADGMASELGHLAVQADGPRCHCGSNGCLETYSSATGMLRIFREALKAGRNTSLQRIPEAEVTPELIHQHAHLGDPLSREILETAGRQLGVALASLVNMFNPEILVIGGGVAAAWDMIMPSAIRTMNHRAFKAPAERVKVVRAEKEAIAGIFGAAYVAWDLLQHPDPVSAHEHRNTPWGSWEVIEETPEYKVKRLYVHPGHRLSYQKHEHREETWMIASGEATITLDGEEIKLKGGQTIHIHKTQAHRIANFGEAPLIFFEVQRGSYFGEDDIVRLQDDYKRN